MTGPSLAVAAVRVALRRALADVDGLVLVACSGGADSLALAEALAFERASEASRGSGPLTHRDDRTGPMRQRSEQRAGLVTIDHGLHADSAAVAARVVAQGRALGLDPVRCERAAVGRTGGPEGAARSARYAALERVAEQEGAVAVLLAHTLDDQAETVLLGLARGSGTRSLAGMPAVRGVFHRPLLGVPRDVVRAACALEPWEDPANADPAFTRTRVRHDVLPFLESRLGPGVAAALARTARAARDDADALDELAAASTPFRDGSAAVDDLGAARPALRRRWLRSAALAAGCPAGALTAGHVDALEALVLRWRGQGPVHLPGGASGARACGRLVLTPHR
ncbi:tRNA lysidine(34) synthetase TilS [Kineococcus rhizosphaerae]|uniref:tRNA(Ile)-lysidine synthase n=1 Tax=Kineococcus rhizosphaerae TaxID=559628 RepID=A0A2T0R5Q0_9ACTN|nr:tRNA lysidine(34) synthetase TilS [Kineococcus rhizosphaerae]PRY16045.1 tRNA(Ile)-lysidine synthase [Kineococcus rhizosphaerae]